jgi:hypothetical protein
MWEATYNMLQRVATTPHPRPPARHPDAPEEAQAAEKEEKGCQESGVRCQVSGVRCQDLMMAELVKLHTVSTKVKLVVEAYRSEGEKRKGGG